DRAIVGAWYGERQGGSHGAGRQEMHEHKTMRGRRRCVVQQRLGLLEPNRKFCDALFRHAPDSQDPLSPFSEETRPIREQAIEHLRLAVEGGDTRVPPDLQERLPYLLWLYQMALILFWIYDRSPGQQRTQQLTEKSLGLIVTLIRLSTLPLMKPVRRTVLELVETLAASS